MKLWSNRTRPLTGILTFHLYPSFGKWSKLDVTVNPKGLAEAEIESFGPDQIGNRSRGDRRRNRTALQRITNNRLTIMISVLRLEKLLDRCRIVDKKRDMQKQHRLLHRSM